MPVKFTQEQTEFAKAIADFGKREAGTREQRNKLTAHGTHAHNQDVYAKMADLGWLGLTIPEEYGGSDASLVDMAILLEETQRAMLPIGAIGPTLITGGAYEKFGTEAQKDNVLRGIVRGASQSISMSEPEAGSDVANISTRAEKTSAGWVVNGQKSWCSNAHISENILLVARTSRGDTPHEGLTMFHVPTDTAGLKISPIELMGGQRETNDLYFTDCELPADAVIGEVGNGWRQLMTGLNFERVILAAMILGTAERAFSDTLEFVPTQAVRPPDRLLPDAAPPHRRSCHRDRMHQAAGLRRRSHRRREPEQGARPRGVDGEAEGHRDREAGIAGRHADDGRIRLCPRVRHGTPRPRDPGLHHFRRDQRDPARHHRQDLRAVGA
jgi:alkylation response protein AidB-like acyl-CoA dehydrogenase